MKNKQYALVIGASQGIGRGVAITLAKNGYHCLLVARSQDKLKKVKVECDQFNQSFVLSADINHDLSFLFNRIHQITEKINFVWLGAAVMQLGQLKELNSSDIENLIRTGFESQVKLINRIYPLLKAGQAQIINACSDDLWGEEYNYYGPSVYQSVKLALASFGKLFQKEAIKDGIKVTNLKLGDTGSFAGFELEDHQQQIKKHNYKMLTVKQVCQVIAFICTQPTTLITNLTMIPVDPNY